LTIDGTPLGSERKKVELKVDGKCFLCQKEGHMARHCPQQRAITVVLADLDKESSNDDKDSSSSSSSEQPEN
jgi:hypothetical protein